jgi:transcriptional regulator with XRE-family HTH domain
MAQRDVDLSISIGTVVQRWRLARGLTLTELARRAGPPVSKAYLSQVEHGKVQHPGPQHLIALAQALDLISQFAICSLASCPVRTT